jgi:N-acetylglucosaminyldiphosphoundecaprenol N-acetyl-beta-D-mannosaminyltransferase
MALKRIELLGVPVDVCRLNELDGEIIRILEKPGTKQIVFLSVWDLLRARNKKKDFCECLKNADLILPISKSIISGAKFLRYEDIPVRYNPFDATILFLSAVDQHYKSIFLLGGRKKTLQQAERNVHETFPNIRIVGRYVGYFPKDCEADVITAIHKASPSLAIISEGIKEKNLWAFHRRDKFASSIFLYYNDCLGIFSKRIRRVSEKTFERGHEIWSEIAHNPFKIFLIFPFSLYVLLLLWSRFFRKPKKAVGGIITEQKEPEQKAEETPSPLAAQKTDDAEDLELE